MSRAAPVAADVAIVRDRSAGIPDLPSAWVITAGPSLSGRKGAAGPDQDAAEPELKCGNALLAALKIRSISSSVSGRTSPLLARRARYLRGRGPLNTSPSRMGATSQGIRGP